MKNIIKYLSMVKFAHSIFAMPFAILGFFLALKLNNLPFDYIKFTYIILCMIFARNTAMSFNRYIDRNIDKQNERTSQREVAAGIISSRNALIFTVINAVLFCLITYFINILAFALSPIALLVIIGYSYTKRFTFLCHLVLGLGLSLAPIGAYISITGSFNNIIPILISFAVLFWSGGFDIIYALQDEDFDKEQKLFSIPSYFGKKKALNISLALHFLSSVALLFVGYLLSTGMFYWIGVFIFIILLIRQHILVKPNDLSKINLAFFTTNGIASIVFAFFAIISLYI